MLGQVHEGAVTDAVKLQPVAVMVEVMVMFVPEGMALMINEPLPLLVTVPAVVVTCVPVVVRLTE